MIPNTLIASYTWRAFPLKLATSNVRKVETQLRRRPPPYHSADVRRLLGVSAHAVCSNTNFAADTFITKWNERATTAKLGPAWHLEKYNRLGFIRQDLDGSSLLLTAKVDKSGCVTQLDIKSRRADADGYAALVAWSSVIIATNPTLPKEQRQTGRQSRRAS